MNSKILKENKILYSKIIDVDIKPNQFSKTTLLKNYRVTSSNKALEWRTKEMKRINFENEVAFFINTYYYSNYNEKKKQEKKKKLQEITPHYNFRKFTEDSQKKLDFMDKLSRNASLKNKIKYSLIS